MAKTNSILVEISPGELIDKITILEIKAERIADARKLANVRYALDRLSETGAATLAKGAALERLWAELRTVNEALWEIEDDIRQCEKFGTTKVNIFTILPNFSHPILDRYTRFLAANDIEIAGIEFIADRSGEIFTYDVNTNTNYNAEAEADAAVPLTGMRAVARFLGEELAKIPTANAIAAAE